MPRRWRRCAPGPAWWTWRVGALSWRATCWPHSTPPPPAVLDVFQQEPLPAAHRFWSHPLVTVLPHVAAATNPRSAAAVVAANVRRHRAGAPVEPLVDRARGY